MKTPDRTPPLERESPPHKRRKGKHLARPFKIEGRYIGDAKGFVEMIVGREWRIVGAYETERARQDALRSMTTKGGWWHANHEYRAV